ncbi:MAG: peptidase M20, partial [Rubripirellula sp.]
MTASEDLLGQLAESAPRHLAELVEWLRIPSISSDSTRINEVKQAADWVADKFESAGLTVEILPTQGHPMVYAESPKIEGAPVVLVYGHYDVQPVEPLDEWVNGPFEPTIR